jgi:hypothetical protein
VAAGQGTSKVEAGSNTLVEGADTLQVVVVAGLSTGPEAADRPSSAASSGRGIPQGVVDTRPQEAGE